MNLSILRGATVALRRSAAVPLVLTVAVGAAGCASSEDVEFVDGYNAAVAPLSTTMSRLSASLAGDPAAASKSLDRVADELVDVRADLRALDPPDDAADEFDRLLDALAKAPRQVHAMARATKDGDLKRLSKATTDLSRTGTELVTIEQELRDVVEN
jgi:hypothetical protein